MRPHPKRTSTNPRSPRAWGTCDRSGFITNHEKLSWQFDWRGTRLENLRVLVAPDMLDKPQRQLGTIILPPDPVGILNARPESYVMEEGSIFYLIQHATGSSSGLASASVTLPSQPFQGNMVAVGVVLTGAVSTAGVSDGPNTYTETPSGINAFSGGGISIFYLADAPANAGKTITVKTPTSMTSIAIFAAEFGGPSLHPLDTEAFASGSSTSITLPSITTSFPDILFAVVGANVGVITGLAPWQVLDTGTSALDAYIFQSVAGTQAAKFSDVSTGFIDLMVPYGNPLTPLTAFPGPSPSLAWGCQIAAFKSWLPLSP